MELSQEQELVLIHLSHWADAAGPSALKAALLECWEARLKQKNVFLAITQEAGLIVDFRSGSLPDLPEDMEDLEELFGYEPTGEEADRLMEQLVDAATMELDIDEVIEEALEPQEDWWYRAHQ